jgi:hypothetical protein
MDTKIISFTYTKTPSDVSSRKLLVIDSPRDNYLGLEVSNDLTDIKPYLDYLAERKVLDDYLQAKYKLKELKLPYKCFKSDKISDFTEEIIAI